MTDKKKTVQPKNPDVRPGKNKTEDAKTDVTRKTGRVSSRVSQRKF